VSVLLLLFACFIGQAAFGKPHDDDDDDDDDFLYLLNFDII